MKLNLKDFLELDMDGLLALNGGSPCSGSSGSSSSGSSSDSGGGGGQGSTSNSGYSSNSGGTGGGTCSGSSTNNTEQNTTSKENNTHTQNHYSGGGSCSILSKNSDNTNGSGKESGNNDNNDVQKSSIHTVERDNKDGTTTVFTYDGKIVVQVDTKDTKTGEMLFSHPISDYKGSKTNENDTPAVSETNSDSGMNENNPSESYGNNTDAGSFVTNGQGYSVTSSDPAGTSPVSEMEPKSGLFGQITDGSYADKLTMQEYAKNKYKYSPLIDEKMNGGGNVFSMEGCKMTAAAKVISEILNKPVDIYGDINEEWDKNKDGNMSKEEIAEGMNRMLDEAYGDLFDVATESISGDAINLNKLNEIANEGDGTTYVIAKVNLGKFNDTDTKDHFHYVVFEGYTQDSAGNISFAFDGTSDNDNGRTYLLGGEPNFASRVGTVVELQTFTINRK